MNRPIKFRVWDKRETKGMSTQNMLYDAQLHDFWEDFVDYPGYELMQYTGLTDKNKNLIYEGDIVKFSRLFEKERKIKELKSFVRFHNGQFGFDLIGFNDMFFTLSDECGIEVIGNIFEHSELLKTI